MNAEFEYIKERLWEENINRIHDGKESIYEVIDDETTTMNRWGDGKPVEVGKHQHRNAGYARYYPRPKPRT